MPAGERDLRAEFPTFPSNGSLLHDHLLVSRFLNRSDDGDASAEADKTDCLGEYRFGVAVEVKNFGTDHRITTGIGQTGVCGIGLHCDSDAAAPDSPFEHSTRSVDSGDGGLSTSQPRREEPVPQPRSMMFAAAENSAATIFAVVAVSGEFQARSYPRAYPFQNSDCRTVQPGR